jgi:hypothetical protein
MVEKQRRQDTFVQFWACFPQHFSTIFLQRLVFAITWSENATAELARSWPIPPSASRCSKRAHQDIFTAFRPK